MKYLKLFESWGKSSGSKEEEQLIELLKTQCAPFLKEFKVPLFRGYSGNPGEILVKSPDTMGRRYVAFKKQARLENRSADSTPSDTHGELNDKFEEEFGIPVRNGIFTTFDYGQADRFGEPFYFFPIGEYRYFWSKEFDDLWSDFLYNKIWLKREEILVNVIEHEWEYKEVWFYKGKNIGRNGQTYDPTYHNNYEAGPSHPNHIKDDVVTENPQEHLSFDEYKKLRLKEFNEHKQSDLDFIINNYEEGNYEEILSNMSPMHKQRGIYPMTEITFWCKEYILIDQEMAEEWGLFNRLIN